MRADEKRRTAYLYLAAVGFRDVVLVHVHFPPTVQGLRLRQDRQAGYERCDGRYDRVLRGQDGGLRDSAW